jgi:protein-S-isoprenylcysteine O-methyltransferase Ste14
MDANLTRNEEQRSSDLKAGILKRMAQVFFLIAFQSVQVFLSVGRTDWWPAWVYVGTSLVMVSVNASFMLRYSPETIAERAESRGMKDWDKVVGGLFGVMFFLVLLPVAGLDERFGWPGEVALWIQIAAIVGNILGHALFSWAMISNAFFSTVVRIQDERGHAVCTTGPYRLVRHPGYVGAIIQSLTIPLMLGSLWALIPGGLAALLVVVRTALEDQTLDRELTGYAEYAQRVRYRLLPGVW